MRSPVFNRISNIFHNTSIYKIGVIIFIISLVVYLYPVTSSSHHAISPDEVINSYFSHVFSETGELTYISPYFDEAGGILRPRGSVLVDEWSVASGKFLGYILVAGAIEKVLGEPIKPYIVPFFGALGVFFFLLLTNLEFGKGIAVLSALIMSLSSSYLYWTAAFLYEDVLGLFFIISGSYFLFYALRKNEDWSMLIGSLLLGLSILFKPFYIAVAFPLLLLSFLHYRPSLLKIPLLLSPFLIGVVSFLCLNKIVYGGFFTTGFHLIYEISDNVIPVNDQDIIVAFLANSLDYLVFILPFSLFGILGLIYYFRSKWESPKELYFPFFVVFVSACLAFYVLGISGASNIHGIHHSAIRYLLFIHIMLVPFTLILLSKALALRYVTRRPLTKLVICVVLTIILIFPTISVIPSIDARMDDRNRYASYDEYVTERIEDNAIILCQYVDKIYFPDRITGNPNFSPGNKEWSTANITYRLFIAGYPVYFAFDVEEDVSSFNYSKYENYLANYDLHLVESIKGYGIFKVQYWHGDPI